MLASQHALAHVPASFKSVDAAPLLCAGITTYNSLRHSGARGGDIVAIQGIGGLGHLGVQFAHKMGFRTVAISSGQDKKELALKLGADSYIDSSTTDAAQALKEMGGAKVILCTAPDAKVMSSVFDGLTEYGKLLIVAADGQPLRISPAQLIRGRHSIQGWPSGHARDSEDTLEFSALTGVRPMVETFPLEDAGKAFDRMIKNHARFRCVLKMT
jgi:D-arabinose 1-dehydrogenase-like Zn-dependent alcohol dehydrogenase